MTGAEIIAIAIANPEAAAIIIGAIGSMVAVIIKAINEANKRRATEEALDIVTDVIETQPLNREMKRGVMAREKHYDIERPSISNAIRMSIVRGKARRKRAIEEANKVLK